MAGFELDPVYHFGNWVVAEIVVLFDCEEEVHGWVVEDLQKEDDNGVFYEDEVERKTLTQKLQLLWIVTEGNRVLVDLLQAVYALLFFLILVNESGFGCLAVSGSEIPVGVENVHL